MASTAPEITPEAEAEVRTVLHRIRHALEHGDADSLLRLYADDAQLSVSFCSTSTRSPRVVRGKSVISGWVTRLISGDTKFRVVDELSSDSEATVIAEGSRSDGTRSVIACTAHLVGGLVARQFVVVV